MLSRFLMKREPTALCLYFNIVGIWGEVVGISHLHHTLPLRKYPRVRPAFALLRVSFVCALLCACVPADFSTFLDFLDLRLGSSWRFLVPAGLYHLTKCPRVLLSLLPLHPDSVSCVPSCVRVCPLRLGSSWRFLDQSSRTFLQNRV